MSSPTTTWYTFDLEDSRAGLLRRTRNGGSSIEVVSGGKWVDHPDGLRYFENFGGDALDLVELSEDEARAKATELGVSLDEEAVVNACTDYRRGDVELGEGGENDG